MEERRMTTWKMEEMACPRCGKKHNIKKYEIINALEKPDIKQDILQNRIFYFQCDECKLMAPLTYPSFYLDSKKKLMILLAPVIENEEKELMNQWKKEKGFRKRWVDNINDLKEKIMIAENHLDDRVIELVKVEYLRQLEKEMKDDTLMNILFDYSGNEYCFVVFFEKKGTGKIPMSLDFYRQTESRYVRQLTARSGDDFEKIDVEWAGNIILNRQ